MGSINAQQTAIQVLETIRMGKKVKLGEIIQNNGYSKTTSTVPSLVTNTKSYKTAFALESKPILEGIQLQINKAKEALANKDLNKEEVRTLVVTIDVLIKNYQLLSGGATERQVFVLPSEVMDKNIIASDSQVNI